MDGVGVGYCTLEIGEDFSKPFVEAGQNRVCGGDNWSYWAVRLMDFRGTLEV